MDQKRIDMIGNVMGAIIPEEAIGYVTFVLTPLPNGQFDARLITGMELPDVYKLIKSAAIGMESQGMNETPAPTMAKKERLHG